MDDEEGEAVDVGEDRCSFRRQGEGVEEVGEPQLVRVEGADQRGMVFARHGRYEVLSVFPVLDEQLCLEAGGKGVVYSVRLSVQVEVRGWRVLQDGNKHKHGVVEGAEAPARPDEIAHPPHVGPHAVVISPIPLRPVSRR